MSVRPLALLIFCVTLLGSYKAQAVSNNWAIFKNYGVRFPLPRNWLRGSFNPISTIKTILLHPVGARIIFATEALEPTMDEKKWAQWSLNYLKKRKFKIISRSHLVVMGKPMGISYRAKRKKKVISMVHIKHGQRGLLFTFSCSIAKMSAKDKKLKVKGICEKREKEFNDLLLRIILF
ncbi:hypothetical protein KKF84_07760 [Myxococcota bacterium]|nr:hypothetical protein [Myxococcota bacterium]MBU1535201.1 hypothetical protein [Myxococcota bacterium]